MSSTPNFTLFFDQSTGPASFEGGSVLPFFVSGVVVGTNPNYTLQDFLNFYPAFGGLPLVIYGEITASSPIVTSISSTAGILPFQPVALTIPLQDPVTQQYQQVASPFPDGTAVLTVDSSSQITLTQPATVSGNTLAIYTNPLIPFSVLAVFVYQASSNLVYNRYLNSWTYVMALYIAHLSTLFLRTSTPAGATAGQVLGASLTKGILTNKSAGGVSAGVTLATVGSENWGHFATTEYGVQLINMFKCYGSGTILLY